MKKIKLLIADDHQMFVDGLELIFSQVANFEIIGTAKDGSQLLSMMHNLVPDIIILDISMPNLDGRKAALEIFKNYPGVKVLVISMSSDESTVTHMINLGVHGYVLKNAGKNELEQAINDIYNGEKYFSRDIATVLAKKINKANASDEVVLTDRELEILHLLFEGLQTSQIADKLFISPRTVDTHRKNLLAKAGANNTLELVHICLKTGLLHID